MSEAKFVAHCPIHGDFPYTGIKGSFNTVNISNFTTYCPERGCDRQAQVREVKKGWFER